MNDVHLGERVEYLAKQKGITVEQLAHALGRHEASVYEIFKKRDFTTSHLKIIADLMNLSLSVFFNERVVSQTGKFNTIADQSNVQTATGQGTNNMNIEQLNELNMLRERVNHLTEQIKLLKEMNEMLKNRDK